MGKELRKSSIEAREIAKLISVDLKAYLNEIGKEFTDLKLDPKLFAELADMVCGGEISRGSAKTIFLEMVQTSRSPRVIAEEKGLKVISDTGFVEDVVKKVFHENPQALKDAVKDEKAINFLLGQIMRATLGRVDPSTANRVVRAKIASMK